MYAYVNQQKLQPVKFCHWQLQPPAPLVFPLNELNAMDSIAYKKKQAVKMLIVVRLHDIAHRLIFVLLTIKHTVNYIKPHCIYLKQNKLIFFVENN